MDRPPISIVGLGRVGGSIAAALKREGYTITASGDVTIVAVPDEAIPSVASQIASSCAGRLVVHTSGGTSVQALAPVRDAGGRIGSMHPLQTIPRPDPDALRGAAVAITCDDADRPLLEQIARDWGGRPFALADEAKPRYHAAAVFASNYVVTCIWAACALLESAGVRDGASLLAPLAETSWRNAVALGPAAALTGPVVRGDMDTVRRHEQALGDGPMREAYSAMAALIGSLR